jgi:hypothetical protein
MTCLPGRAQVAAAAVFRAAGDAAVIVVVAKVHIGRVGDRLPAAPAQHELACVDPVHPFLTGGLVLRPVAPLGPGAACSVRGLSVLRAAAAAYACVDEIRATHLAADAASHD